MAFKVAEGVKVLEKDGSLVVGKLKQADYLKLANAAAGSFGGAQLTIVNKSLTLKQMLETLDEGKDSDEQQHVTFDLS